MARPADATSPTAELLALKAELERSKAHNQNLEKMLEEREDEWQAEDY